MFIKRKSTNLFKKSAILSLRELKKEIFVKPANQEVAIEEEKAKKEVKQMVKQQKVNVKSVEKKESEPKTVAE